MFVISLGMDYIIAREACRLGVRGMVHSALTPRKSADFANIDLLTPPWSYREYKVEVHGSSGRT